MLPIGAVAQPVEPVGFLSLLEDGNNLGFTALFSRSSTRMCPSHPSFHREGVESSCDRDWHAEHPSHRQQILWPQDNYLVRSMETDWPNVEGRSKKNQQIKDFLVADLMFLILHVRQ